MHSSLHLVPNELATLGYTDLSHISETEAFRIYRGLTHDKQSVLIKIPIQATPGTRLIHQLEHELAVSADLNPDYVVRPNKIERGRKLTALILQDCDYPPLTGLLDAPLQVEPFLTLAIGITCALAEIHRQGLVHRDITPANIFVTADGKAKFGGFGVASRHSREWLAPTHPQEIDGSLAYMAPEQTGRINRAVDNRSDLYALGVVFYQMLTAQLPFDAGDPMEWIHCHIAIRPRPPQARLPAIPAPLSKMIMKLLAKDAEARYQTAEGLKIDLQHCLDEWRQGHTIKPFKLGRRDIPSRLVIPEKLYGREPQLKTLLDSLDRIAGGGKTEMLLVCGYAGVGKSSLVNEMHRSLVSSKALFAQGKFDQYQQDIPYATLAQALQGLVGQILGKREEEIQQWRDRLIQALAPNGRLVTDLVPDLVTLIGEQPLLATVPPQDSQNRFNHVIQQFINTLAQPEHPLVLFLDDLQWLDTATLQLLEYLLTNPGTTDLLLLGAYRDNEVGPDHPLKQCIDTLRNRGTRLTRIELKPLTEDDLCQLIADTLHTKKTTVRPLAGLVQVKSGGNPFFTTQFLHTLADENLLTFNPAAGAWRWNLKRIQSKGYAENVIDLMIVKLAKLPKKTQQALGQFACLGMTAETSTQASVFGRSELTRHDALLAAVQVGLVLRCRDNYRFLHDRVREAAYTMVAEQQRPKLHLQIGYKLLELSSPHEVPENLFDVVHHLNLGADLVVLMEERLALARLNLQAGLKAKASAAFHCAADYFEKGLRLLGADPWSIDYDLTLSMFVEAIEGAYLTTRYEAAQRLADKALADARHPLDRAKLGQLKVQIHTRIPDYRKALDTGLSELQALGISLADTPPEEGDLTEIDSLPLMTDPLHLMAMNMMFTLIGCAYIADPKILSRLTYTMVELSRKSGISAPAIYAYGLFGALLVDQGRIEEAQRFGNAGLTLCTRLKAPEMQSVALNMFNSHIRHWKEPLRSALPDMAKGVEAGLAYGDIKNVSDCGIHYCNNLLFSGTSLAQVDSAADHHLTLVKQLRQWYAVEFLKITRQTVQNLIQPTNRPGSLHGEYVKEDELLPALIENDNHTLLFWFYTAKTLLNVLFGRSMEAIHFAEMAVPHEKRSLGLIAVGELAFYHCLALLGRPRGCDGQMDAIGKAVLDRNKSRLSHWADHAEENFRHKYDLVLAEAARVEGRFNEAMGWYEKAIGGARKNGYIHEAALACELTAGFHLGRDMQEAARVYLLQAHALYTRWGALAKVSHLASQFPHWLMHEALDDQADFAHNDTPDAATMVNASQAVSSEIELAKLIETLMFNAVKNAGADRGLLIIPGSDGISVAAEAKASENGIEVTPIHTPVTGVNCAQGLINRVIHTLRSIIVDDASHPEPNIDDPYLTQGSVKSILCLPLIRHARLTGILYLENTQTPGAFTRGRLAVLDVVATQAAISLQNSRLYETLKESEQKFRTLVEKVQAAVVVHGPDTQIITANSMAQELLGLSEAQLLGKTAIDPTWHFLREDGSVMPLEAYPVKQVLASHSTLQNLVVGIDRPDREEPIWALVNAIPLYDESGGITQVVVSFYDISERKKAEQQLIASEQLFRTLVENSPNHISRYDLNLRRIYINPTLEKTFAVPLDRVLHRTSMVASPLLDPARYMANLRKTIETARDVSDEIAYRTPQGDIRWASTRFAPEFDANGKVQSVLVISNDITEHKKAVQQLANTKQMYQTLVENLPDCVARFDADGHHLFVNAKVEETFGMDRGTFLKRSLVETRKPGSDEQNRQLQASIKRVFESGNPEVIEAQWETVKGIRNFEVQHVPELDRQGSVRSVLGIAHDVTLARQAEIRNREHLKFLQSLDRINQLLQEEGDMEAIMNRALQEVLEIFDCDRAYLIYPCDPDAQTWTVPMESTRPEYPGVRSWGPQPMEEELATVMRALHESDHPLRIGPDSQYPITPLAREAFKTRSILATMLRPRRDKPWQFGIQQCAYDRVWTDQEARLLEEIGHRLSEGLNNLVIARDLRESEERFRLVYENSPISIWEEDFSAVKPRLDELMEQHDDLEAHLLAHPGVVKTLAGLVRIVNVNSATLELYEARSKEELLEGMPKTFFPESYDAFRKELLALSRSDTELLIDGTVKTLQGKRRDITISLSVCPGYEHNLSKVFITLFDITQRKQDEEDLRLAASVFSTSQEGILISDANNRIIDVNPAFTRLTGYTREEALGKNPGFLSAGRQDSAFYQEMWQTINSQGEWQGEVWNRRKSGEVYPELLSIVAVKNNQGSLQHYVGAFSDISMIKQHEADLDHIAHYDMLTSVPNRRLLSDRLEQAIAYTRRHGKNLAVCYLDLDGFKPINDQFGHEGGDRMLVEIAQRLQAMSRGEDTVARLGGDEFVLLWNEIGSEDDCIRALERILDKVSEPLLLENEQVSVSASIGVTLYPDDNVDADSLLRHADHAMYTAKQLGKNRYQIFDARLERQISARAELMSMVERGLEKGEFELYYQPKVDYTSGEVIGLEALLRWNDPVLGLVLPNEFLSLIENDSLAIRVGRLVMEEAVRQAKRWDSQGIKLPISINIFPRHMKSRSFIDDLRNAIALHWPQMPQHRLLMEIIETSDLEELEPIEDVINECLMMGVGFSLDDFGTGYSSLVYLRRLTIEELKIDQSFVRDMLEDPDDEAIVVGVIRLGQAFDLRVVAEGVESPRQARYLANLGCTVVQGYGMGRPMPVYAFQKWYGHYLHDEIQICHG